MKILMNKAELKAALVHVNKLTNLKTTKPILQDVRIESGMGRVILTATDLEVYIKLHLEPIQQEGDFVALVNAKQLAQAVRSAGGKQIELGFENRILTVAGAIQLPTDDPEEFPLGPKMGELRPDSVTINGEDLALAYKRTQFAVAKDMSCYAYNGLLFEARGQLVATDGRRLSISKGLETKQDWTAVLVKKGVELAARIFAKADDVVVTRANTSVGLPTIQFIGSNDCQVWTRQLEGDFPKYEDAVPEKISKKVLINREAFQPAIEQAAALNKDKEVKSVELDFDQDGRLHVVSQAEGVGAMKIEVEAIGGPKGFTVTVNPDFLMDWLKSLEKVGPVSSVHTMGKVHGTVVLGLQAEKAGQKSATKAMILQDDDDQDQTYILMPITDK